jgi:ssDNA-binding Zn-finger/Zn-ribbon topoisomerase 1
MGDYADMEFDRSFHEALELGEDLMPGAVVLSEGDACLLPGCKGSMKVRTNRQTGQQFLGCSKFPACRFSH